MPIRLSAILACVLTADAAAEPVDFSRDVLPILSDNCFHCHGPDEPARKAKLRLDTKEGAFRVRDGVALIVPGKSAGSELMRRIASKDHDEVMPPPKSNRKLTAAQVTTIGKWIDEGAKWGTPWALTPLPKAKPGGVDAFIRERLAKEGMKPSDPTTREMWLRRVTFDLTGLPPTPAETDAFLKDSAADAFDKVVDRLLASPRYGERMAADWLDVARFADTHGYQSDRARPVWPYRDWVIKSFNRNQRFDEFLTWQLAGDLLPKATQEQRLATAFNRLHMQNEEGGVVAEEFRVAYVVDRVTTFGTAFLGLTFDCCRCHDHKFDPITQKDFYRLFAFFQNIDESGQTSYFTSATPVPALLLTTPEQDKRIAELRESVKKKEDAVVLDRPAGVKRCEKWKEPVAWPMPGLVAHFSFDEFKDNAFANTANPMSKANGHDGPKMVPGKQGSAVSLNGENGVTFPNIGHFDAADAFTLSLWIKPTVKSPRAVVLHHSQAPVDAGSRGYELLLEEGRVAFGLHHMWPGNSIKVVTKDAIPLDAWTHVAVCYAGNSSASGIDVYVNGKPTQVEIVRNRLTKDITYGGNEPTLAIGYRFRDNGFKGGTVDEFSIYDRALTWGEAGQLAGVGRPSRDLPMFSELHPVVKYYLAAVDEEHRKLMAEVKAARKALNAYVNPIPEIMVMDEMPTPKPAFVLTRGNYDQPGERVTAGTPAVLPAMAKLDRTPNRLDLAKWTTEQPLTARVTVNRLWQQMFGRGIVATSDNFGSTGSPPTHPELLDWLAADFVAQGWDVKRTLKMLALSQTYRQSAKVSADSLARDPGNELLARMPARRLTAEMMRDQALAVSGLLVEKQGGPSVYPYQPEGLWNEAMGRPGYPRSKGDDLYRRGLYTFWKRTAPPPALTTFDAADRSVCSANRQSTSTPLQALNLLNDPTMVESARFLAERMLREGGKTREERSAWAFRVVATRSASPAETKILGQLFDEQAAAYGKSPDEAKKLLSVGDRKADPKVDAVELAAATSVALAILNHDAAVMRR